MTDQANKVKRLYRWLVVATIVVIASLFVFFWAVQKEIEAEPVAELLETSNRVVTPDRMDELEGKIEALNLQVVQLTRQLQEHKGRYDFVEPTIAQQAATQRAIQDRFSQIDAGIAELNDQMDETLARQASFKKAAEAAQVNPSKQDLQTPEPIVVSSLMRWGEQVLAVVKTSAGYRSLGTGDQFAGWQIVRIELNDGKVSLRHLASEREVVQSLRGEAKVAS